MEIGNMDYYYTLNSKTEITSVYLKEIADIIKEQQEDIGNIKWDSHASMPCRGMSQRIWHTIEISQKGLSYKIELEEIKKRELDREDKIVGTNMKISHKRDNKNYNPDKIAYLLGEILET